MNRITASKFMQYTLFSPDKILARKHRAKKLNLSAENLNKGRIKLQTLFTAHVWICKGVQIEVIMITASHHSSPWVAPHWQVNSFICRVASQISCQSWNLVSYFQDFYNRTAYVELPITFWLWLIQAAQHDQSYCKLIFM